uniref:Uncharacterized protein n=1 Tax=Panagrolaimus davidi TaxID=227884 RepID=A0A914QF39_9BILA
MIADFQDPDYIAISLYYVDGPISAVDVYAHVDISTSTKDSSPPGSATPLFPTLPTKSRTIHLTRGRETEILHSNRQSLTTYIKERIGKIVRLSVILEMDANLFKTDKYLNSVSPTPVHSFLTANYRARVRSKVWRKKI